jgi:hypothetical protein
MEKYELVVVDYDSLWGDGEGHTLKEWYSFLEKEGCEPKYALVGIKRNDSAPELDY